MNFKKLIMMAFALCVTLLASTAAFAQAQRTGPIVSPKPPLTVAQDIEVKIEMCEDQSCTKPMPNGANLSYSGGAPAAYIRFTLRNNFAVKTDTFTYKRV